MILNNYNSEVQFFAGRAFTHNGTAYTKGAAISDARTWKNLEALVTRKYVIPVTADRNLLPKMFLRELRSVAYCTAKFGFTPTLTVTYPPSSYTSADVVKYATAHPAQLTAIIAAETSGTARSGLLASLTALKATFTSMTPATGSHLSTTATVITGTNLTLVTGVTFGGTSGTAFSVVNATTVNVTAPVHAAGTVNVVLTGGQGGTVTATNAFIYT